MAKSGGQPGNKCAAKGAQWRQAIRKALAKYADANGDKVSAKRGLELVAEKFVEAAAAGEPWAMKELGDRIDGKPSQGVELSGPAGGPIEAVEWSILPVVPIDRIDEESPEG